MIAFWAPIIASAVGAGINHFAGAKGRRQEKRQTDKLRKGQDESITKLQEMVTGLSDRGKAIRTDYTPTELYGPIIQNMTDRVQSDSDSMSANIFRSLMGSGGDISGTGQSALQGIRQTGQRSISDTVARFTELTDARNRGNEQRADNLEGAAVSGQGNLSQLFAQLFSGQQGRSDRKQTAGRQSFLDILGLGTQTAGMLYNMEKKPTATTPNRG